MATREPIEINQVGVLNSRTEQAISRVMPRGRALGASTPMGTVVGFKEYKDNGDDRWRGVVLEDRGDRVLVSEANTRLSLGSTRTLNKSELVNLGVDRDDEGKINNIRIAVGDQQRVALSNGTTLTIRHGYDDASGKYAYFVGDHKEVHATGWNNDAAARRRLAKYLKRYI